MTAAVKSRRHTHRMIGAGKKLALKGAINRHEPKRREAFIRYLRSLHQGRLEI